MGFDMLYCHQHIGELQLLHIPAKFGIVQVFKKFIIVILLGIKYHCGFEFP